MAEDYRAIELEAGELTKELREIEKQIAVLKFQADGILKSLQVQPDIGKDELLELYTGLCQIFKPEIVAHFEAVENFHNSLSADRKARLESDRIRLVSKIKDLEEYRSQVGHERDEMLSGLQGKRALDEYASLAKQLAKFESERERLREFLEFSNKLQKRVQHIKEKMLEADRVATNYAESNPLKKMDEKFSTLSELLYPRTPSGIILDPNLEDNQLRYKLAVEIEGDDSDGINAARIICFDLVLLFYGANHNLGFLWHDNRLFAHIDPRPRAAWFSYIISSASRNAKQYIASVNTENFEAMKTYLSKSKWDALRESIAVTLRGDRPENKLLGVQFGR